MSYFQFDTNIQSISENNRYLAVILMYSTKFLPHPECIKFEDHSALTNAQIYKYERKIHRHEFIGAYTTHQYSSVEL